MVRNMQCMNYIVYFNQFVFMKSLIMWTWIQQVHRATWVEASPHLCGLLPGANSYSSSIRG